jgi:hypothetical protein
MGIDYQARQSSKDLSEVVIRLLKHLKKNKIISKADLEYIQTGIKPKKKKRNAY